MPENETKNVKIYKVGVIQQSEGHLKKNSFLPFWTSKSITQQK
jgi:hypothetical protein